LDACDETQRAVFRRNPIKPYYASIQRYGKTEKVVVVARNSAEVIYYEDVEEGFNVSPVDPDGAVLRHWCNQDTLGED
jgi:hypothetical protein